ncbi:thermonuclease family protein [Sphingomonas colocasiae]|uniref:Thermonuclease family protein n=1 Tax=Sphingomonas colocasiae TaxID=1848973 RepID=A0ABS7PZJ0_9SPHN|nr:thermonuclease family protein [Sphingomonas colocasiae]MBY8826065.1 thermonuclease family protein [Sphingomonas colocasiae]
MENIVSFRGGPNRGRQDHYRRAGSGRGRGPGWPGFSALLLAGCLAGLAYTQIDFRTDPVATDTQPPNREALDVQPDRLSATGQAGLRFELCHSGGGRNCVVDGDTFWADGAKIRIADIDTPETHPPRCAAEAELGARATRRLQALLNQGPFELEVNGRATDRYGRQLRTVTRNGRSIGDMLVAEGLARPYGRGRRSWCD